MGRHRKTRRRTARSTGILRSRSFWLTLVIAASVGAWLMSRDTLRVSGIYQPIPTFHAATPAFPTPMKLVSATADPSRGGRAVYPYSVVRGGVASVAELRAAMAADPVVGAHYAAFDLSHARVTQAGEARMVYVSYRRGNRLYWTKSKLKLAKGEKLITDGVLTARSRCANQVSDTPNLPTSSDEPAAEALDTPDTPQSTDASSIWAYNSDSSDPSEWGSDLTPIHVGSPLPGGGDDPAEPGPTFLPLYLPPSAGPRHAASEPPPVVPGEPQTPVVSVPEPSTLLLLLSGLPAIWAFRRRKV